MFSIRTSNIQRTIDSARCLLAGMFGVGGIQGGHDNASIMISQVCKLGMYKTAH